jgi:hypothetical protein
MDTKTLAAGIVGFLLGGFTVSVAATLDDGAAHDDGATHDSGATHHSTPVEPPFVLG